LVFSRPAGDQDFDGIQAAGYHPEAELFSDFPESVLLEAIAHALASVHGGLIAIFKYVYLITFLPPPGWLTGFLTQCSNYASQLFATLIIVISSRNQIRFAAQAP
jgi:hypothetical protein